MINRQQVMLQDLEQLIIQNQQKDELLMMLVALNKQNHFNSDPQYHNLLQNLQQQQSHGSFYCVPSHQNALFNNNHLPHYGFGTHIGNPQLTNHLNNMGMLNQTPLYSLNNIQGQSQFVKNTGNLCSNSVSRLSNMSNATTASSHSQLNNPTSETNLFFPECGFNRFSDFSQAKCIRDSETKKNLELSDFSMQLEESTTRASLNKNQIPLSHSPFFNTQFGFEKTLNHMNKEVTQPSSQQYFFSKQEEDADNTQKIQMNDHRSSGQKKQSLSNRNSNFSCGYKLISKDNSNNFMSKMNKNSSVSRIADTLTYIYTFEPQKLEQGNLLEELFFNNQKQSEEQNSKNYQKSNSVQMNTTIIQLNSKNCDDPLGNLSNHYEIGKSDGMQYSQSIRNKNQQATKNSNTIEEDLNFNTQFLSKSISLYNIQQKLANTKLRDDGEVKSIQSGLFDQDEDQDEQNDFQKFVKKGHLSIRLNLKLVNLIENFLKKQLLFSINSQKDDENNMNDRQELTQKTLPISEKIKTLKGQLDFEDVTSHISLETNVNEEALKKEIQQILHSFKSNHKVYFKKVRSQKEMLKDTKFHNLNKRIMRVLLSILNNPIILQLKVPQPIFKFFHTMSSKLVHSSKKLIKNTIVNDQYSHAHYNTMFLQISSSNYQKLSQSQSDIELHKIIYDIDLSLPYSQNYFEIQKTNILKQYIYLILDRTLRLNDTSHDSPIQAIRSMYIERVIKGMEKMNAGKIVQRF